MTILTIYSPSGDATLHQEAVGRDGTPEAGQPLGYCVEDRAAWPCSDVRFYVLGEVEKRGVA